jgi:hypothetical protein
MQEIAREYGPFAGLTDRQIDAILIRIRRWTDEGKSPEQVRQLLMAEGRATTQVDAALKVFLWNNTLVSEGAFAGLTERQRAEAIEEAGVRTKQGIATEEAIRELMQGGLTEEQARAAIAEHRALKQEAQRRGAPGLILAGFATAAVGVLATVVSNAVSTSHHRVYFGAIVGGVIMAMVGMYRRSN